MTQSNREFSYPCPLSVLYHVAFEILIILKILYLINNCLLLHIHKEITDHLDLAMIAKEYISVSDEHIKFFGSI